MKIQKYKHDLDVSYALGATLTYELLKCAPELATRVFINSQTKRDGGIEKILEDCEVKGIPVEVSDKAFNILSPKGNCFVIAEFEKAKTRLKKGDHIVLVNPSDAGNMGTILRTATGFGLLDVAVIRPAVDAYDPRTVRASMGAIFHTRIEYFDSIDDYIARFPENRRYAFMLTASSPLPEIEKIRPFSLIFGNEATGLPDSYAALCESVIINHSNDIDSLNLPTAAGIAIYEFTKDRWNGR
ncbi:MAG: TrmH family RNA methyltransferase [Firmicutes bacterium]|nr:TrmH family RNA methyltransferase [Bacillota bacterium]